MFKVNNKDTRTTPGVVLVSLLLTLNIFHTLFSAFIVNFEQVIAGWDIDVKKEILETFSKQYGVIFLLKTNALTH